MSNFKNLRVWQRAIVLTKKVYQITNQDLFKKDFGLKDQVRRSAVSIASNIAEGDESGTDKQAIRFFNIAKGSSGELYTQIVIAESVSYINADTKEYLLDECEAISSMLYKLISKRG